MGFKTGNLPPVDAATFHERPFFERIRILATQSAEYGFGTPKMVHVIYIVKLLVLYIVGGLFDRDHDVRTRAVLGRRQPGGPS